MCRHVLVLEAVFIHLFLYIDGSDIFIFGVGDSVGLNYNALVVTLVLV